MAIPSFNTGATLMSHLDTSHICLASRWEIHIDHGPDKIVHEVLCTWQQPKHGLLCVSLRPLLVKIRVHVVKRAWRDLHCAARPGNDSGQSQSHLQEVQLYSDTPLSKQQQMWLHCYNQPLWWGYNHREKGPLLGHPASKTLWAILFST